MNRSVYILLAVALVMFSASCQKIKEKEVPVASVTLNKVSLSLLVGETESLIADVLPENATNKTLRWDSSSPTVASVEDGVVTAISEGVTTITVFASRKTASCLVTVSKRTVDVVSVTLDKTEITLEAGSSETLSATVLPEDATDKTVSWTSSDDAVATVADGTVCAVAKGSAVITASAGGKTAACNVTVKEKVIAVTGITLDKTSLELEKGQSATLTATVTPDNASDKAIVWGSSDASVASVTADGLVEALETGSAEISVQTRDGGFKATCAVTVVSGATDMGGSLDDYTVVDYPFEDDPSGGGQGGSTDDYIVVDYPFDDGSDQPGDWTVEENYDTTPWLATNAEIESFLENVTYTDDFSVTHVTDYAGGPGTADIPPSYTVSWTSRPEAGALTFHLSEGSWSQDFALDAGASQISITNLVPGRSYQYTVKTSSGGKALARGSFITTGRLHQVYFTPNVRNGRDLGGWTAAGGKTVAFRKIYRGGRLDGSYGSSSGKADMRDFGIKAEIDLRYDGDGVASSSPLGADIDFFAPKFEGGYHKMIQDNPDKVAACFTFIVQSLRQGKPVYFHCLAGRDRTGTLSMLLLGLLGVDTSDLRKDYELTYFAPEYWSLHNGVYEHSSTCWSFRNLFKILKDTGESTVQKQIEKLLLDNGVPQQDIDDFRALMLE